MMEFYGVKQGSCVGSCAEVWKIRMVDAVVGGEYYPIFTDINEASNYANTVNGNKDCKL